jgi:hypothetical protein
MSSGRRWFFPLRQSAERTSTLTPDDSSSPRFVLRRSHELIFPLAPASAQVEHGRLLGTVKDAQGGVLPGVTVTATSPALIGQRAALTESDGRYLITNLLGRYELPVAGVGVGANMRIQSGYPWSPIANVRLPPSDPRRSTQKPQNTQSRAFLRAPRVLRWPL